MWDEFILYLDFLLKNKGWFQLYSETYYALHLEFAKAWNERKIICTLETGMYRAMKEKQDFAVASNAKISWN